MAVRKRTGSRRALGNQQHIPTSKKTVRRRQNCAKEEHPKSATMQETLTGKNRRRSHNQERQHVQSAENVHEDDLCPVCRLMIYDPVTTGCKHTLCRTCMATWADVSLKQSMVLEPVSDRVTDFDAVSGIEARCPMCRTSTSAAPDHQQHDRLKAMYPRTFIERESEEQEHHENSASIQTITLYIGNRHRLIPPCEESPANQHEWTFFVRPSRSDIIEEVQAFLHPTFRPSRVVKQRAPYEIRRVGWGVFIIEACIILKAGYSWVSSEAEDSPDGASRGMVRLEWELNFDAFDGTGAMTKCKLKVKHDRDWDDVSEEEERDQADWNRAVKQYQRDGKYVPPEE